MWIYVVYSRGPKTLHSGTPKMYVTFFTPWEGVRWSWCCKENLKSNSFQTGWPQHVLPPHWASSKNVVARAALQPNQAGHYTRPKTRPLKFTFGSVDLLFALLNMLSQFLLSLDTKIAELVCCLVFINLQVSCPQEARQVPNYVFHQSELHRLQRAEGNIVHTMVHWAHQNKTRQTWTEDLVWCLWSPIKVHCSYCPWSSKWP